MEFVAAVIKPGCVKSMNENFRMRAALSDSPGVVEDGWTLIREVIIYVESEIKRPIRKII